MDSTARYGRANLRIVALALLASAAALWHLELRPVDEVAAPSTLGLGCRLPVSAFESRAQPAALGCVFVLAVCFVGRRGVRALVNRAEGVSTFAALLAGQTMARGPGSTALRCEQDIRGHDTRRFR